MLKFYLISNWGTLNRKKYTQEYPRHLWLAQVLLRYPERVTFAKTLMIDNELEVILDNGAYEGVIIHPDKYLELAIALNPWCVVLPDLVNVDYKKSRERCMSFYHRLTDENGFMGRVMYVPQGQSKAQVLEDFSWAIQYLPPERFTIGLGKCYQFWGKDENARIEMFRNICARSPSQQKFINTKFHMLGARKIPTEYFAQQINIIGIDSLKPIRCANAAILYPKTPTIPFDHDAQMPIADVDVRRNVRAFCQAYGIEE